MFLRNFRQGNRGFLRIDRHNKQACLGGTSRFEQVHTGCIAVVYPEPHLAQQVDPVGIVVKNGGLHTVGPQKAANGAAKMGESGNYNLVF